MSNYINNLIAKSQNAAEVVRPRLPSIFEPPSLEARTAFVDPQPAEAVAPPAAAGEAITARSPDARLVESSATAEKRSGPSLGIDQPAPQAPTFDSAGAEVASPAWRGIQRLAVISERAGTEPLGEPAPPVIKAAGDMPFSRRPVIPFKAETPFAEARTRAGDQADESAAPPQTASVTPNHRPAQAPAAPPSIEADGAATSPVAASPARIVVHPRVTRRDENLSTRESGGPARRGAGFQPDEPPPAPTINVTIGRIEVKALPPAAARPRQPQPAAAPLLSLDEYLRKRDAGGESV